MANKDLVNEQRLRELSVPIIDAPSSTTLTDEQVQIFKKGCVVNGSFLGYTNPLFFPSTHTGTYSNGIVFGYTNWNKLGVFKTYRITNSTKYIATESELIGLDGNNSLSIRTKAFPSYPTGHTSDRYLTYGTNNALSWTSGATKLYKHTITSADGNNTLIAIMTTSTGYSGNGHQLYLDVGAGKVISTTIATTGKLGTALLSSLNTEDMLHVVSPATTDQFQLFNPDNATDIVDVVEEL